MHNYSIRIKLILLLSLSSIVALLIATISNLTYYYYDDKDRVINASINLAEVSGKNIAASLMFHDRDSINTILKPILENTNVKYIKIYNNNGEYFTSIGENNNVKEDKLSSYEDIKVSVSFDYINILTSITYSNERIGFLKMMLSTDDVKASMLEQIQVSFLIMFATIIIILILAFWLEKIFTNPIFELLKAMNELKKSGEFNVNLVPYSKDEFRELFLEFNNMANEISKRDKILKDNNLSLEQLVKTTQNDLEKVSILASTDVLTNLKNRRYTMDMFEKMIQKARITESYLGIIMLDIDHFKSVNDTLGHHAGDIVIKEIAAILESNARENDVVGRIGGEEFLILCTNSDMDTTFNVAERVRKKIENKVISYEDNKTVQVTISLGVYSSIPKLNKEELMKVSDEALYRAKKSGRNRVEKGIIK